MAEDADQPFACLRNHTPRHHTGPVCFPKFHDVRMCLAKAAQPVPGRVIPARSDRHRRPPRKTGRPIR